MLTIYLKDGNILHSAHTNVTLSMIDSITISGDELWKVAQAPYTPLLFSRRTLEDMLARNGAQQVTTPSSIQLILDILRGGERRPQAPPEDREGAPLDEALERTRVAMKALKEARDLMMNIHPSPTQQRILEACQKLGAKGYSVERVLGILDADGRPELDTATGKTKQDGGYTP